MVMGTKTAKISGNEYAWREKSKPSTCPWMEVRSSWQMWRAEGKKAAPTGRSVRHVAAGAVGERGICYLRGHVIWGQS